ncbi:hypothetical protein ACLBWP_03455 [Microbacterium sp. M1A1_1b]
MADERKCYAGDLGTDALGKHVDLGDETVVGPVVEITHRVNARGVKTTRLLSDIDAQRVYDTAVVEVRG